MGLYEHVLTQYYNLSLNDHVIMGLKEHTITQNDNLGLNDHVLSHNNLDLSNHVLCFQTGNLDKDNYVISF